MRADEYNVSALGAVTFLNAASGSFRRLANCATFNRRVYASGPVTVEREEG
jgi:hypothetical protein